MDAPQSGAARFEDTPMSTMPIEISIGVPKQDGSGDQGCNGERPPDRQFPRCRYEATQDRDGGVVQVKKQLLEHAC
jgi:hypothetical protein